MKFLLDENENAGIIQPLRTFYPSHTFDHVAQVGMAGLLDVPLFEAMHSEGYTALMTQDRAQITTNFDELDALLRLGIHWIGRKQSPVGGIRNLAIATATHLAAMPDILEQIPAASGPLHLRLANVQIGMGPRVKATPLAAFHGRLARRTA